MKNSGLIIIGVVLVLLIVFLFVYNQRKQAQLSAQVKQSSEKGGGVVTGLEFLNNLFGLWDKQKEDENGDTNDTGEDEDLPPYM